jgi:pyridoxal phosphate enzyme (YggS family)
VTDPALIAANLTLVHERIERACARAGRDPRDVTLIAVSKTQPTDVVRSAMTAGQVVFGENRVQEAAAKIAELGAIDHPPEWHLVGHLQRNKAGHAARLFDAIHSIDSLALAQALDARAERDIRVFIEVNISDEATKDGVEPAQASGLAAQISRLRHLQLVGLMTVAPLAPDPEDVRPAFKRLHELRHAIGLRELSMGMTDDFEVAVEEGATFVRVGRAIFGERAIRG